jgi:hypothetical protein
MSDTPLDPKIAIVKARVDALARSYQMGAPILETIWPSFYQNKKTGKIYRPHHDLEAEAVANDEPRYLLLKGGEGSGKSCAGIVKDLNKLRRGCDGIMVSPDLPHFKKSLWPEFQQWCPPKAIVAEERYKLEPTWEPSQGFALHFHTELGGIATLYCGGIDDPTGWHGPNVNFAHMDEAHRHPTADGLKTIDGRLRIPGPSNVPPQVTLTSTPKKNWLYEYFGEVDTKKFRPKDPLIPFKLRAKLVTLLTKDNEVNTFAGYADDRRLTLTEKEARVLLDAEWEDMSDSTPFLPGILIWDKCLDFALPNPTVYDPMIVALDAGVTNDSFGLIAVSPHPLLPGCLAVQAVHAWVPDQVSEKYLDAQGALDFRIIRDEIRTLIEDWNIIKVVYDRHELHLMAQDLSDIALIEPFSQQTSRLIADKHLRDLILQHRVLHRGEEQLRQHLENADAKIDDKGLRIVKREANKKIDLAVCLSMASYSIMEFVPKVEGYVATGMKPGQGTVIQQLYGLIN